MPISKKRKRRAGRSTGEAGGSKLSWLTIVLVLVVIAGISGVAAYVIRSASAPAPGGASKPKKRRGGVVRPGKPSPMVKDAGPGKSNSVAEDLYLRRHLFPYLRKHQVKLNDCYYAYKKKAKGSPKRGLVTVKIVVDAKGAVSSAIVVRSRLGVPVVEKCVVNVIRTWKLPPPKGISTVGLTVPLFFR